VDLTPWSHEGVVEVRVRERTIAGGVPGTVIRCVLDVEHVDGTVTVRELEFGDQGFSLPAFEAFIRGLNQKLKQRRMP